MKITAPHSQIVNFATKTLRAMHSLFYILTENVHIVGIMRVVVVIVIVVFLYANFGIARKGSFGGLGVGRGWVGGWVGGWVIP